MSLIVLLIWTPCILLSTLKDYRTVQRLDGSVNVQVWTDVYGNGRREEYRQTAEFKRRVMSLPGVHSDTNVIFVPWSLKAEQMGLSTFAINVKERWIMTLQEDHTVLNVFDDLTMIGNIIWLVVAPVKALGLLYKLSLFGYILI